MQKNEDQPYWRCEECGREEYNWPMPKDREKFYASGKPRKCPMCASEAMMPVGF